MQSYAVSQETLIVWSEADNFDYALSFQDKAGCDEIWEKICEVSESCIVTHNSMMNSRLTKIL